LEARISERVVERFVVFHCKGDACVGVISAPQDVADFGIVVIVGGPQYRIGSHRQFALLARALAETGVPCLRFDYRGMGDSEGERRGFEDISADIAAAIDALCRETGCSRVVLWGLCDGASAALIHATRDARIAGVAAINPWAHTQHQEATVRLRHYYLHRFVERAFWVKWFSGTFDIRRSVRGLLATIRKAFATTHGERVGFLDRMQQSWKRFTGPVLIVLSGNDLTAREFESWISSDGSRRLLLSSGTTQTCRMASADHTFSSRTECDHLSQVTAEWMKSAVLGAYNAAK
jgi:exosortase A-associated hydrolase 1